jgi:hypothetical protein
MGERVGPTYREIVVASLIALGVTAAMVADLYIAYESLIPR